MRTIEPRHVVPDIAEEHLEELACLSVVRRSLLASPDAVLVQYEDVLERMDAHRDGLRTAAETGRDLVREQLEAGDPFDAAAALEMWIQIDRPPHSVLCGWLEEAPDDLLPAWREALRRLPEEAARAALAADAPVDSKAAVRAALLDARAWHGLLGAVSLRGASEHVDPVLRAAAARAHGFLPAAPPAGLLADADVEVRRRALWSAFLAMPGRALEECRRAAQGAEPDPFDLRLIGIAGEPRDLPNLRRAAGLEESATAALLALGDLGRVAAVPILLEALAGGAGTAAAALERLLGDLPGASEDEEDALPGATALQEWWHRRSGEYSDDARYVRGVPFPFAGEPGRETMESLWLAAVLTADGPPRLRREVPDGFFTGLPSLEAEAGV